jgi:hypothetical protein
LVINEGEAQQVRAIFALYLELGGLLPVIRELDRRAWRMKAWTTRKGQRRGGRAFGKTRLQELLTNPLYTGRVRYRGEIYSGEQPALIEPETWQNVQDLLAHNRRVAREKKLMHSDALLAGLVRCRPCGCAMTPARVVKRGGRRYNYYTCTGAQKRGWDSCPSKSIPAPELERFVLQHLLETENTGRQSTGSSNAFGQSETDPVVVIDPDQLSAAERIRLVRARLESVEYDGAAGKVAITMRSAEDSGTGADDVGNDHGA